MIKNNQISRGVRVKLNSNFKPKCLGDEYLLEEPILFIEESHCYNDAIGEYVFIKGGSLINSGTAYLDQLDLEFPIPEAPLYSWKNMNGKRIQTENLIENHIDMMLKEHMDIYHKTKEGEIYPIWFDDHQLDLVKNLLNRIIE